ncbi:DUF2325 domain-containing protein [Achromobacter anxifer]|uniref:DUF2325 domain-containing protein n=1 Tax=Achromobacter anxifer TaxID=1287737 RepID=UPI002157418B|nr:DUF2325 domain-containing protein [Achromobacter anxifer]
MHPTSPDSQTLQREHAALLAAYGQAQSHCSRLLAAQAARIVYLEGEAMRLRAAVILRDSALAWEREDRKALETSIPGLPRRVALARSVAQLMERVQSLMRERLAWQGRTSAAARQLETLTEPPAWRPAPSSVALREKAVLCVGVDAMALALTRKAVEQAGGRCVNHDADMDTDGEALEASLVAADLVICQTGCVSHGAYWRVKDHCTRTGKQCVLVDKPEALHALRLERQTEKSGG